MGVVLRSAAHRLPHGSAACVLLVADPDGGGVAAWTLATVVIDLGGRIWFRDQRRFEALPGAGEDMDMARAGEMVRVRAMRNYELRRREMAAFPVLPADHPMAAALGPEVD